MLFAIVAFAIFAHAALFFLLFSKRWNPLYILAAAYLVVAPISGSSLVSVQYFKYGRVYLTLLLVAIPVLIYRHYRLGAASTAFCVFASLYFAGALWSDYPLWGMAYKGLFGLTVLSGVFLATSTRSLQDFSLGMRILLIGGAAFAAFILLEFVRNPAAVGNVGRLMAFGINPNRIGQTVAPLTIVAAYLVLYSGSKFWKLAGYVLGGVFVVAIVYTGSRGAAGMALIGCVGLLVPYVRRPGIMITVSTFVGVTVLGLLSLLQSETTERLGEVNFDTRRGVWSEATDLIRQEPVWGNGWAYVELTDQSATTQNLHSIYFQVLAEIGVVGLLVLLVSLLFVLFKCLSTWRVSLQDYEARGCAYFSFAMLVAIFAHGVIESGSFIGTTANAMLLGFALGMVDRLPTLIALEQESSQELDYDTPEHPALDLEYAASY